VRVEPIDTNFSVTRSADGTVKVAIVGDGTVKVYSAGTPAGLTLGSGEGPMGVGRGTAVGPGGADALGAGAGVDEGTGPPGVGATPVAGEPAGDAGRAAVRKVAPAADPDRPRSGRAATR